MRVLIADDDPMQRLYLTRCLSSWGYETLVVEDGEEAWRILQRDDAPQMVLLDWMMPGMDGTVLCQHIRGLKDRPYTFIVLLTARRDQQDLLARADRQRRQNGPALGHSHGQAARQAATT